MSDHPNAEFIDILTPSLSSPNFERSIHIYYATAVVRVQDGPLNLRNILAEFGGSGETMPE